MSELPYIPPRSPEDHIPEELVVLFLEAVARVTPAFQELREQVFPKCDPDKNDFPLDAIEVWLRHWRFDTVDRELTHLVHDWTIEVLRFWAAHPAAREALAVDCGWWVKDPKRHLGNDIALVLPGWNPYRETYKDWRVRVLEPTVRKHHRDREAELEKYGATPYEPENTLAFDWLALKVCLHLSDGAIAKRCMPPKVKRDTVKKACTRLAKRLHIDP